ncbi:hypothetical protein Ana3638_15390 [Anaerocolumna sedimenticola]|uniref:Uncharacterized protein n=1 Tax=Anaerocolumna sedimenticola TaxID=2696063 RepID=A0A6P1TNT3_9FIRM|nr:hypothetical protein [Anaerocolumna sedimenticola]QHQ61997.1 hypothetical protein Ana3638_15390 [Anaerocolumna sedimenticola]
MKLKYKKLVVMITMCTMGIGLVTFSITRPSDKSTTVVENSSDDAVKVEASLDTDISNASVKSASLLPSATPTPTEVPETKDDVAVDQADPLEKNAHKEINTLIKNYLNAKLSKKIDKFKPLVNDISYIDLKDIARKTKYIEAYKNVTCYTKKGPEEGSYIVYAYHEVKFSSIKALAPAMNEFYVKMNEKGKLYIYLGEIDNTTKQYLDEVRDSDEVMDLIYDVNEKLQKVVADDKELHEFYSKLEESAKNVTMNN